LYSRIAIPQPIQSVFSSINAIITERIAPIFGVYSSRLQQQQQQQQLPSIISTPSFALPTSTFLSSTKKVTNETTTLDAQSQESQLEMPSSLYSRIAIPQPIQSVFSSINAIITERIAPIFGVYSSRLQQQQQQQQQQQLPSIISTPSFALPTSPFLSSHSLPSSLYSRIAIPQPIQSVFSSINAIITERIAPIFGVYSSRLQQQQQLPSIISTPSFALPTSPFLSSTKKVTNETTTLDAQSQESQLEMPSSLYSRIAIPQPYNKLNKTYFNDKKQSPQYSHKQILKDDSPSFNSYQKLFDTNRDNYYDYKSIENASKPDINKNTESFIAKNKINNTYQKEFLLKFNYSILRERHLKMSTFSDFISEKRNSKMLENIINSNYKKNTEKIVTNGFNFLVKDNENLSLHLFKHELRKYGIS